MILTVGQQVKEGLFREDLYYRLQGFLIHLAPLRERGNDPALLAKYFLKNFCDQNREPQKSFSADTIDALLDHSWPGNIRELKASVERAALISDSQIITSDDMVFSDSIF